MIKYKIFKSIDNSFKENFLKLSDEIEPSLFNNFYWIKTNVDFFLRKQDKVFFIIFFEEDMPIAFYPLIIQNFKFFKVLTYLNSPTTDYCGPVIKKWSSDLSMQFKNLWHEIKKNIKYDLIYFEKMHMSSLKYTNFLLKSVAVPYQNTYSLTLKNLNFKKFYIDKNNKKSIQTDRRKEKKLCENNFILREISLDINILNGHIKSKENFYKKKNLKTFQAKKIFEFYTKIMELDKNKNIKFKYFQYINDQKKVASSLLGILYKRVFYYLIPLTVQSEFIKQSPGSFLLKKLIESFLLDKEKEIIDFGPGDEIYKNKWCNQKNKIYYILELKSINGKIYYLYKKLYFVLRKNYFIKYLRSLF